MSDPEAELVDAWLAYERWCDGAPILALSARFEAAARGDHDLDRAEAILRRRCGQLHGTDYLVSRFRARVGAEREARKR